MTPETMVWVTLIVLCVMRIIWLETQLDFLKSRIAEAAMLLLTSAQMLTDLAARYVALEAQVESEPDDESEAWKN